MRILLVEDELSLSRALTAILQKHQYSVDSVYDGLAFLDYATATQYDGIILDIMLPGLDGFAALKRLRENGCNTPVLILSARSEVEDKVRGLDLGANDYMTKPFDSRELLARVRAMTRCPEQVDNCLRVGNVTLDCGSFEMSTASGSFRLANKEFQMFEMLMRHPRNLIPTERFLEHIWGYNSDSDLNVVWVYISYLRKKLLTINANVRIKARRNTGYSLEIVEE